MGQDHKLKQISQYKNQLQTQIDTARRELTDVWDKSLHECLKKLEVSELRMQNIEIEAAELQKFFREFKGFKTKFEGTVRVMEQLQELPRVVERQMPMLTHFQISEALHEVLADYFPTKVKEF